VVWSIQRKDSENVWADGDYYEGEWNKDQREGLGTFYHKDGRYYTGSFKDNWRSGFGTYYWPSGDRFEGQWVDNDRHGSGKMIWKDGNTYTGEFEYNVPKDLIHNQNACINPSIIDCLENSICSAFITGTNSSPQMRNKCSVCGHKFCEVCWETCHKTTCCHPESIKKFAWNMYCFCGDNLFKCKKREGPPSKKQKRS